MVLYHITCLLFYCRFEPCECSVVCPACSYAFDYCPWCGRFIVTYSCKFCYNLSYNFGYNMSCNRPYFIFYFLFFSLGWILPSAIPVWVISRCVFVSLKRIASTYTVLHMYYMYRMYHIVPLCVSSRIASHRSTFLCVHLCMYICVFYSTSGVRAGVTWILDYIWTFELHLLTFDFWLFSYILYSIRYISVPHDLLLL